MHIAKIAASVTSLLALMLRDNKESKLDGTRRQYARRER